MPQVARVFSLTPLQRYGAAVLGVVLTALARLALDPFLKGDLPLFLFFFPIVGAAWLGGLGPGLVATALSLLLGDFLFLEERGRLFTFDDPLTRQRILALVTMSVLFSILFDRLRRAIKERLECLERFGLLVDAVKDYAILSLDNKGRITCANNGAARVAGYDPAEVAGRHISVLYPPEEIAADLPQADLNTAREEGRCEKEGWQIRKDGSRFWASGVIFPLRAITGEIRGYAKVIRDMTAHRQAYEALRESRRFARRIVDVLPDVIHVYDVRQNRTVFSNRDVGALLGYDPSPGARFPAALREWMHPDDWPAFVLYLRRLINLTDDIPIECEYRLCSKNGEWRRINSREKVFSRDKDGSVLETIGIATDVTERRFLKEKARFMGSLNEALGALDDPEEMMNLAARMLGEYLRVDWCAYCGTDEHAEMGIVRGVYAGGGASGVTLEGPLTGVGDRARQMLLGNRPYVVNDRGAESGAEQDLHVYRQAGIRALLRAPLIRSGRVVAVMEVQQHRPRVWTGEEIRLTQAVVDRCWEFVDRARAHRRLKQSDSRYRAFIANSSEGIWRFEIEPPVPLSLPDAEQLELLYQRAQLAECNDAMAKMYGYDRADEMLGARLGELIVRSEENMANLQAFKRSGYRLTDAETHEVDRFGQTRYFLNNLVGVVENGAIVRAWGTQRDITSRREAEEARRKSEEDARRQLAYIESIYSTAPVGLCFVDAEMRIGNINEYLTEIDGRSLEEHLCHTIGEVVPDIAPQIEPLLKSALESGRPVRDSQVDYTDRHGALRHFLVNFYPIKSENGRASGVNVVVVEITQLKQAEEERERLLVKEKAAREEAESANRLKDEFLATISHELRTPLTAILGWTHLLSGTGLAAPDARHALDVIERSAKAQARLVDDILDVSHIITGSMVFEPRVVDLEKIFVAAVDVIRPSAEARRIDLRVQVSGKDNAVWGDAARLQQVIWNLLSNAVKFTNEGGWIEARLSRTGNQVEILISDSGIGIDPLFLSHVFERFRQADSTPTRKYGGLGLGLAIVRHLVEMHGGSVAVSSPGKDQGSTFTVRLPAVSAAPSLPRAA
ncbi:MAG TPA: PAS domain S-box protein [Terriglobia bacterium]|nr:PAS domain S-box protein [Terriglobia bacterium]